VGRLPLPCVATSIRPSSLRSSRVPWGCCGTAHSRERERALRPLLLVGSHDIRAVQEFLGHEDSMIYTHVLNGSGRGVQSPVDKL